MKVIIDIPKDVITDIKECDFDFARNAVRHFQATIADAIKSGKSIPDNATNGDMFMIMFPNLKVEIEGNYITCWIDEHQWFAPDYNWWNAPYMKEVEE